MDFQRVERREMVDGFSKSREKRDGGWVLVLEYKGEREREREREAFWGN